LEKKEYEKSFEFLLRSNKILEKMNPEEFPNIAEHLNFIGRCYFYFKDYRNAIMYYEKSSKLEKTKFNANAVLDAQNTLGLCYQKLGKISLSSQLFSKIISDTSPYKNETWKKIASGNLGYNYYLEENYEKAIPLLKNDIQNAMQIGESRLAAGSAIPLADIYVKQNKLNEAKQKIEEAKESIQESGETDRLRKLYPVISKWYAANKEPAMSAIYLDSAVSSIDAYNEKYNGLKLLRANQKVEAIDRQMEIEKLHTESRIKISQRNYIILSIALLLMGSLLAYWFRNKYLLRKQEIKELRIENTEKALAQAKNQLQNLKTKIQSEQEIIESLQQELQTNGNQKLINELKSKIIITNEDWNKYQRLFEEAYPTYLSSLKKTYTKITPSELRCLCLEKLQLSNKEMALVLGISTNSIVVTKHRIRKKLKLNSQQELQNLVRKIE
jgi:tetratricopeptide (TPR) repeat protein